GPPRMGRGNGRIIFTPKPNPGGTAQTGGTGRRRLGWPGTLLLDRPRRTPLAARWHHSPLERTVRRGLPGAEFLPGADFGRQNPLRRSPAGRIQRSVARTGGALLS